MEAEVGLQLLDRFIEEPVGLTGRHGVEGPDTVPADDRAVPLDDSVVAVDEVLAVAGVDDVAREVGLGARRQPATAGGGAALGPADDGERIGVRERSGLEACSEVAERARGVSLAPADRHRGVQGLVVHTASVVDDEQADEAVLVAEEADDDVTGARVDGVVDQVGYGCLEAVALVRQ